MKPGTSFKIKDFDIFAPAVPAKTARITPANPFSEFKKEAVEQSLTARFEEQVKKYKDKVAVVSGQHNLTYETLNRSANRLAHTINRAYDDRYKLSPAEKIRYTRQLLLWGIEAQEKLKSTTVFAAGAGGSGTPVIMQLALMGVGTIIVSDHDTIELSNLNRQFLYDESMIGMNKALAMKQKLAVVNPHVNVIVHPYKVNRSNIYEMIGDAAVIFDNIDDVEAKFCLSECAYAKKIPHVISSMIDLNSYAAIFHPPHAPCFHCLYDREVVDEIKRIQASENYEKIPNSVACPSLFVSTGFAVNEAIKIILGFENPAYNKYFLFNQRGSKDIVNTKGYRQITFPFSAHFKQVCREQGFDWEEVWRGNFVEELDIWPDPNCPLCSGKREKNFLLIEIPREDTVAQNKKEITAAPGAPGTRQTAALLLQHDAHMAIGLLGALKSAKTYVPMDTVYPDDRLQHIVEDSEARVILTDAVNFERAVKIRDKVNRRIAVIDMDNPGTDVTPGTVLPVENPGIYPDPGAVVYIMYTSGSTGKPKAVMQNHRNVLHYIKEYTNHLHIDTADRLTQFSSYSFDASVMDIYGALLNGASLYPFDMRREGSLYRLAAWLQAERITIYHSVPTVYRYFSDTLTNPVKFPDLRLIVLGGEPVYSSDVEKYKKNFPPNCILVSLMGSTEASITMLHLINHDREFTRNAVPLGEPVAETEVQLLTENNQPARLNETGEIIYKSPYLALDYLAQPGQNNSGFTINPLPGSGRVYRSGDLGRLLQDGSIEYAGRVDFQVKIGGYRIELGEIECAMDKIAGIKKSVVVCKQDRHGENYLVGYFIKTKEVDLDHLVRSLKQTLPEYMTPGIFMGLDTLPLTRTGKIDRGTLPDPVLKATAGLVSPRDEVEEKIAETWAQVLDLKKNDISIDANFFELGGQSFKAIILAANLHKKFNVRISLGDIFDKPTIREFAANLRTAAAETFTPIPPAEKKEFYKLSSAQKRLFTVYCIEPGTVLYNINNILEIHGEVDPKKLENVFQTLVMRHENLRTSFQFRNNEPVQVIHDTAPIHIDYDNSETGLNGNAQTIARDFIKPFDLAQAPLLRIKLVKRTGGHLLLVDMHHIITDGSSMDILTREFFTLYSEKQNKLEPVKLQYKDFSEWQNRPGQQEKLKKSETFWLQEFAGELPLLNLPTDFSRPLTPNYTGSMENFVLGTAETNAVKQIAREHGATVFMVLLAIFKIFLYKISGQEDMIISIITSGRWHKDLENIIGFFANMLPLRSRISPGQTFNDFVKNVRQHTLNAFENQAYRLEDLLGKLDIDRNSGRNPLTEIGFALNNRDAAASPNANSPNPVQPQTYDLKISKRDYEKKVARADLIFFCIDEEEQIIFNVEYSTELFKQETIIALSNYLKNIAGTVAANPDIKITEINIVSKAFEDKKELDIEFNI